ncbi:unannotated protein [freshwater metagenome]|uniref:Unannotated protein n=1 Tax=freshwater metagenome TaxID=449393 RepID=A0A6J7TPT3_9ZZZZ
MLYAIQGNIQVQIAIDNSISSFSLTEDGPGLIVPPGYWAKQIFLTSFSILGVMASHPFNPDDYVHEIPPVFN